MVNCTALIYAGEDVLDVGQRTGENTSLLHRGPAMLSSPSRGWEKAAALEGQISGMLYVTTATNLSKATSVEVRDNARAGTYQVANVSKPSIGSQWALTLQGEG